MELDLWSSSTMNDGFSFTNVWKCKSSSFTLLGSSKQMYQLLSKSTVLRIWFKSLKYGAIYCSVVHSLYYVETYDEL